MANPTNVVLQSGEATPANVVLRSRPGPLATAALVIVTLFAGEATPSNVVLRQTPVRIAQTATTLGDLTVAGTGTVTGGGGGVNGTLNATLADMTFAGNELLYSEQFDNGAWANTTVTVTPNSTVAPDGNTTADTLAATGGDSGLYQTTVPVTAYKQYAFSVYLKAASAVTVGLYAHGNSDSIPEDHPTVNVTTSWQRFEMTFTMGNDTTLFVGIGAYSNFSTGETIEAWGAQLNTGPIAAPYVKTTSTLLNAATGTVTTGGTLNATLADLTLAGTATNLVTGTLAQTLADLTLAGTGTNLVTGTLAQTLADLTLAGTGTIGVTTTGFNVIYVLKPFYRSCVLPGVPRVLTPSRRVTPIADRISRTKSLPSLNRKIPV